MKFRFILFTFFLIYAHVCHSGRLYAADLTVMPTSLKLEPPKVAGIVTVRNEGRAPVKMQVRIFRWEQKNGKDVYYPTTDVVVSPPFVTVKGGADGNIRVARTSQKPLLGVESYRLIIDELPRSKVYNPATSRRSSVEIVTRQILPVFFSAKTLRGGANSSSAPVFHAQAAKGGYHITAVNPGAEVIYLGPVVLLAGGKEIGRLDRVVGNILPKSKLAFFVAAKGGGKPQAIRVLNAGGHKEYPVQ